MMFQSNQKSKCEKLYKNGKITFLIRILEISIQVKLQKNLQKEVFSYLPQREEFSGYDPRYETNRKGVGEREKT